MCRLSKSVVTRPNGWIPLLVILIGVSLGSSLAAAQSTCPPNFAQITCPSAADEVIIAHPSCLKVSCALHRVRIERGGELLVPDETRQVDAKKLKISVATIVIRDGGIFQVGPLKNNRLTLMFTGPAGASTVVDPAGPDDPCPSPHFNKGIEVCRGGRLRLLGTKGTPALGGTSQTYLSAPAGDPARYGAAYLQGGQTTAPLKVAAPVMQPDAQTVQIATDVSSDWQPGDWIVIGGNSASPIETEFVQINRVAGTTLTLSQPLKYYHFGSPAPEISNCENASAGELSVPRCESSAKNGVDQRAEVWLISRDIILTSDTRQAEPNHWGSEIRIRKQFAEVLIQGVQIENLSPNDVTALGEAEKLNAQARAAPQALSTPIAQSLSTRTAQKGYAHAEPVRVPEGTGPLLHMPGARLRNSYRRTRR
jgi:hypothetical protein